MKIETGIEVSARSNFSRNIMHSPNAILDSPLQALINASGHFNLSLEKYFLSKDSASLASLYENTVPTGGDGVFRKIFSVC